LCDKNVHSILAIIAQDLAGEKEEMKKIEMTEEEIWKKFAEFLLLFQIFLYSTPVLG
jgi:hypothetical protein